MKRARLNVAIVGVFLPNFIRLLRGTDWLRQYLENGVFGFLFLEAFEAIAWGSIILLSFKLRRPATILFPAIPTFALIAFSHLMLDLSSDAQAAVALVWIPIYSLPLVLIGYWIGLWRERRQSPPVLPKS